MSASCVFSAKGRLSVSKRVGEWFVVLVFWEPLPPVRSFWARLILGHHAFEPCFEVLCWDGGRCVESWGFRDAIAASRQFQQVCSRCGEVVK